MAGHERAIQGGEPVEGGMTNYVEVWSLQRGIIHPAERVPTSVQRVLDLEDWRTQLERDPPLTMREQAQYEGLRGAYNRRNTRA